MADAPERFGNVASKEVQLPKGVQWGILVLHEGQWTKNPASTKHVIYGPAEIEFRIWPDKGIEFTIL